MEIKNKEDSIIVNVVTDECPCIKCFIGWTTIPGGCRFWKCDKFPDGKPHEVLYENKSCPYFDSLDEE